MKVILISAKAGHGKDYTAKVMKRVLMAKGKKVLIAHYGDLLKYVCKTFFDWDGVKDEAGRGKLQYVGTDVIRVQRPDYWVDFVKGILEMFSNEWDYVLIPDTRFPNEIIEMAGFSPITVRVTRENFETSLTEEQQGHASEVALDDWEFDWELTNDGTVNYDGVVKKCILTILGEE